MKIGATIKHIRRDIQQKNYLTNTEHKSYTQRACADRCGISEGSWRDLEADRHSPSIDTVERALKVLGWRIRIEPVE